MGPAKSGSSRAEAGRSEMRLRPVVRSMDSQGIERIEPEEKIL